MRLLSAGFVCAILFACGDSGSDNGGTGGGSNSSGGGSSTGGGTSDGGATSGRGGGATTGGESTATGGKSTGGTGGKASTGGTGGKASTGGAAGTGGKASTGGTVSTGGADMGGDTGTGGDGTGTGGDPGIPDGLLNPDFVTDWNPGILEDNTGKALGSDGLPVRTTVCATVAAGGNIQAAIDACPEGQVVQLAAGAFSVSATITLTKGVVLRGAGSGTGGTTITKTGGESVIQIGNTRDQGCKGNFSTAFPLTANAVKETNVVTIGSNASMFKAGDLALIDETDDATIPTGCDYYKRLANRSVAQRVEVASVNATAGTVTLTTPLHWTFRSSGTYTAQLSRVTSPTVRYAGVEHVYLKGGSNPGYSGQMAGGIDISNAANSWVKDVQTDQTIEGMHVAVTGSYRVVVRDSYFHHSAGYDYNADCYGIVMRCGSADTLVENNIVRYMNKPILFNASGGGNVVAYNYADNSWSNPVGFQELNIDSHCPYPHMELMEGNYTPHMGIASTHGVTGYLTYFRNYSSSQFASPAVAGSTANQIQNITALQLDDGTRNVTAVGNVFGSDASNDLGTAPITTAYTSADVNTASIIKVNTANIAFTSLWWHANYDTIMKGVRYNPMISVRELPPSLYLGSKPGWWPSSSAWPWAGSDLTTRVGTLPAKARADAM